MFSPTSPSVENITPIIAPSPDHLLDTCSQSSSASSSTQSTNSTVVSGTEAALSSHNNQNMTNNAMLIKSSPNQLLQTCSQNYMIQNVNQNQNSNQNQLSTGGFQPNGIMFSQPSFLGQNIAPIPDPNQNNTWQIPNMLYEKMFREFMFEHANRKT